MVISVLHVNKSDAAGGAAIAANRLHDGLVADGVESRFLVGTAETIREQVKSISPHWLDSQLYRFTYKEGLNNINFVSTFKLSKHSFFQAADVINFHNLHAGYFNYLALPSLTKRKPAVLTLHDMWSFTGHCAYSFECDRWQTGCGQCPDLTTYPPVTKDNTHLTWQLKKWVYQRANLQIVTLSSWLTAQVRQSILAHLPIHQIPNGIDTDIYRPLDIAASRSKLGISLRKQVLMCAAINLQEKRKGSDLLVAALNKLPASVREKTALVVLGNSGGKMAELIEMEVVELGFIQDDRKKAIAYSAADLFVFPSTADNLPLVLQESMACGTPTVAFDVGGVPDLVRPGVTGYLAAPRDIEAFCDGIKQLLENAPLRADIAENCRQITLQEYSIELQVSRYRKLYETALSKTVLPETVLSQGGISKCEF